MFPTASMSDMSPVTIRSPSDDADLDLPDEAITEKLASESEGSIRDIKFSSDRLTSLKAPLAKAVRLSESRGKGSAFSHSDTGGSLGGFGNPGTPVHPELRDLSGEARRALVEEVNKSMLRELKLPGLSLADAISRVVAEKVTSGLNDILDKQMVDIIPKVETAVRDLGVTKESYDQKMAEMSKKLEMYGRKLEDALARSMDVVDAAAAVLERHRKEFGSLASGPSLRTDDALDELNRQARELKGIQSDVQEVTKAEPPTLTHDQLRREILQTRVVGSSLRITRTKKD